MLRAKNSQTLVFRMDRPLEPARKQTNAIKLFERLVEQQTQKEQYQKMPQN